MTIKGLLAVTVSNDLLEAELTYNPIHATKIQDKKAKNIGNHMHTTTTLSLDIDNKINEEKERFEKEKEILNDNLNKIKTVQKKMKQINISLM